MKCEVLKSLNYATDRDGVASAQASAGDVVDIRDDLVSDLEKEGYVKKAKGRAKASEPQPELPVGEPEVSPT
jgi:hypothetical protein